MLTSSIKVYPNPAKENFTIELSNLNSSKVEIFNLIGKLIFTKEVNEKKIQINNYNRFKLGVYFVKVTTKNNNKVYRKKLIIK